MQWCHHPVAYQSRSDWIKQHAISMWTRLLTSDMAEQISLRTAGRIKSSLNDAKSTLQDCTFVLDWMDVTLGGR
jgi:hypothetical protein